MKRFKNVYKIKRFSAKGDVTKKIREIRKILPYMIRWKAQKVRKIRSRNIPSVNKMSAQLIEYHL